MSVNVSIHRGEIKQLERFVEQAEGRAAQGQLFGLWTHSFQPVIQFVTGPMSNENAADDLKTLLLNQHALVCLGNWSTREEEESQFPSGNNEYEVQLTLKQGERNMEIKSTFYNVATNKIEKGRLDKLPGESAFRLFEPLTSKIGKKTGCNVGPLIGETGDEEGSDSEPESMAPVQVNREQWYSTEEGMKLFSLMYRTFTEGQFEIVETSRDTTSQDIRLVLRYRQKEVRLEFPGNFPDSQVNVVREHGSNRAVSLQRDTSQEELAKELREKLKGLFEGGRGMGSKS